MGGGLENRVAALAFRGGATIQPTTHSSNAGLSSPHPSETHQRANESPETGGQNTASSGLIKSVSVDALCMHRDGILRRIEEARALLLEADEIAKAAGLCLTSKALSSCRYGTVEPLTGEGVIAMARRKLDASGWRHLMNESGMLSLMDTKAREEWNRQLSAADELTRHCDDKSMPVLSVENVRSTFAAMHENRQELFERGVINVFKGLGWCYKTNQPQKFGKRIVLSFGGFHSRGQDRCDDLARCLFVLDGKPEPDHRDGYGSQMEKSKRTRTAFEGEYWSAKFFMNGNCHITFKRLDLIEKMNQIIASHFPGCLPAPK